jgi:bacterioferritin (cytochrome b1)
MGFDFDRSEMEAPVSKSGADFELIDQALERNLLAERFAIDAFKQIASQGEKYDEVTLRLVKVALAVEEEHAEILTSVMKTLQDMRLKACR